ncbi:MAG: nuclear transport factor 2 family protein [Dongiaceae bacterium]
MIEEALKNYIAYYEKLTPATIGDLRQLAAADMYFEDPFNKFTGVEKLIALYQKMYQVMDNPRFVILHSAASGNQAYIHWHMFYYLKGKKQEHKIDGISLAVFSEGGKLISHIDYWDAGQAVYAQIPVLGSIIRFIRRKLGAAD